ncbi:MAG: hypothetical protein ACREWG_00710 [Gammaproteobacteria bacterium]
MVLPQLALRPFSRAEDLELEFDGGDRPGLVTALLARCSDSPSAQFWWTQPVGTRIAALLRLVGLTESADCLPVQARCTEPACAVAFEMELPLAAIVEQTQDSVPLKVVLPDQRMVTLRRPTGEDLRSWHRAHYVSRQEAVAAMIGALVIDGQVTPSDEPALAEALSAWDSLVAFTVSCQCPVCGVENGVQVDLESIAIARLDARQRALLQDVHQLASHYGWTESEVLAIAPARRARYLALIEDAR